MGGIFCKSDLPPLLFLNTLDITPEVYVGRSAVTEGALFVQAFNNQAQRGDQLISDR